MHTSAGAAALEGIGPGAQERILALRGDADAAPASSCQSPLASRARTHARTHARARHCARTHIHNTHTRL